MHKRITDWFSYDVPSEDLVKVEFENGKVVTMTKNHELVLPDGSKVRVDQLSPGTEVVCEAPRVCKRCGKNKTSCR